jgi:hypothetical protein
MPRKKTTEQFIAEAKAEHGDRYDYSKVVYVKSSLKVEIICAVHGSFWQSVGRCWGRGTRLRPEGGCMIATCGVNPGAHQSAF